MVTCDCVYQDNSLSLYTKLHVANCYLLTPYLSCSTLSRLYCLLSLHGYIPCTCLIRILLILPPLLLAPRSSYSIILLILLPILLQFFLSFSSSAMLKERRSCKIKTQNKKSLSRICVDFSKKILLGTDN